MGYHLAGFEVTGVDIQPQPRYPFRFVQADALAYLADHGHEYDAFHASCPCQLYSATQRIQGRDHPDLIGATRTALENTGRPWVIENVPGAPLRDPVLLCGAMFGLRTYRHRLFETSRLPPARPAPPRPHRTHHQDGPATPTRREHAHRRQLLRRPTSPRSNGHALGHPRRTPRSHSPGLHPDRR